MLSVVQILEGSEWTRLEEQVSARVTSVYGDGAPESFASRYLPYVHSSGE